MSTPNEWLPSHLQEIVEDFQLAEGQEKLELLIEYSDRLPALPARLASDHAAMHPVEECLTPVFVQAEQDDQGRLKFYFDVPLESPTIRGFAAIMTEGLENALPEQVLAIPDHFYHQMGLDRVLTHQRLNGLAAILANLKHLAALALSGS
jgi:cysteine desulfuration protein SufE